jgi:hypothetical protein
MLTARPAIRAAYEPLTPKEFRNALEQGLGRAILCLHKHDPKPYKQIVLETCLKNTAYDAQCEDSRVPYLLEAIDYFEDEAYFRDAILEQYPKTPSDDTEPEDYWLEHQYTQFALAFAKRGSLTAKRLLYSSFSRNPAYNDKHALGREDSIIELDGLDGLAFVLEQYAKVASQDPEFDIRYFYISNLYKRFSQEIVVQHIEKLCAENPEILVLVQRSELLRASKPHNATKKLAPLPYTDLLRAIQRRSVYRAGIPHWAKRASKKQILQAARELLQQTDPELIRGYLYVFYMRPFPFSLKHLFGFLEHSDLSVRENALIALKHFQNPRVRQLALEMFSDANLQIEAISLLKNNYQLGDATRILEVLQAQNNPDKIHHAGYILREVYGANVTPDAFEPLTLMYQISTCSLCREDFVCLLWQAKILPDWILEEVQFDCAEEIRKQAQEWQAKGMFG